MASISSVTEPDRAVANAKEATTHETTQYADGYNHGGDGAADDPAMGGPAYCQQGKDGYCQDRRRRQQTCGGAELARAGLTSDRAPPCWKCPLYVTIDDFVAASRAITQRFGPVDGVGHEMP